MSELEKIFLTSGITIFGGVFVFVVGQIIQKFFIEPIYQLFSHIGIISVDLVYYGQYYANPGMGKEEKLGETSDNIRKDASILKGKVNGIWFYWVWEFLKIVPCRQNISEAISCLIRISNKIFNGKGTENSRDADRVVELLGISPRKN